MRRIFIGCAAIFTLSFGSLVQAATFTDVGPKYERAVDQLVSNGWVNGVNATQFGTDRPLKRLDAAVIVARSLQIEPSDYRGASSFTDVPTNRAWAVNALHEQGIINGKTSTSFAPDATLTRGEMALILQKAYELPRGEKLPFTDVGIRYETAVSALVRANITSGLTSRSFGTDASIRRGEFALFLYRAQEDNDPSTIEPPVVVEIN